MAHAGRRPAGLALTLCLLGALVCTAEARVNRGARNGFDPFSFRSIIENLYTELYPDQGERGSVLLSRFEENRLGDGKAGGGDDTAVLSSSAAWPDKKVKLRSMPLQWAADGEPEPGVPRERAYIDNGSGGSRYGRMGTPGMMLSDVADSNERGSSESHIAAFTALTTELERLGGHEIHMVVSRELRDAAEAAAAARSPGHAHAYLTYPLRFDKFSGDMAKIGKAGFVRAMLYGYKILAALMDSVLEDGQLMSQISDLQPDLIIGDAVGAYGHWLTGKLGVPSVEFDVGTSSGMLHAGKFGGQLNPAYIPAPGTFYPSTGMTLRQRCANVAITALTKVITYVNVHWGPIASVSRRHGVPPRGAAGPPRPLLLLVNFDWALEPPRPVAPGTHYIGALMPRPPAPLPEDLRRWLEEGAADGAADSADTPGAGAAAEGGAAAAAAADAAAAALPVVYVSFGASFLAPDAAMPALAAALSAAAGRVRLLLRLRPPEAAALAAALGAAGLTLDPRHALIRPRFPQNDVLGHPKVKAFVTQGGYLSMQEAAYHGVPVVGVPLTLGQGELVARAADEGRGALVRKDALMGGAGGGAALAAAVLKVAAWNSSYQEKAALTAARLRAHPVSPGQRATDLVGYALGVPRGSGSFLHTQGQDMRWFEVILLDVVCAYLAAAAAALWAARRGARALRGGGTRRGGVAAGGSKGKRE
ncbi:MAG: hypothetical protein J3K34DRAFT_524714 [Monoraphidium minutum]|nr:MAG: hypothetical protein J3K34DRAFT_524714 [Monoraphidium minutum]